MQSANDVCARLNKIKGRAGHCFLQPHLIRAAVIFEQDWAMAQTEPSYGSSWSMERICVSIRPSEGLSKPSQIAAKMRLNTATTILGPELASLVIEICLGQKKLPCIEKERDWPARSAKLILKTALQILDRHYSGDIKAASEMRARLQTS